MFSNFFEIVVDKSYKTGYNIDIRRLQKTANNTKEGSHRDADAETLFSAKTLVLQVQSPVVCAARDFCQEHDGGGRAVFSCISSELQGC